MIKIKKTKNLVELNSEEIKILLDARKILKDISWELELDDSVYLVCDPDTKEVVYSYNDIEYARRVLDDLSFSDNIYSEIEREEEEEENN